VHGWIANHWKSRAYIKMGKAVLPGFDRVVAVSAETRRAVIGCGVADERVVLIHNAIVTGNYSPAGLEAGGFRRAHGISSAATLIGYVGRLSLEKGQHDFLRGAARVVARHPQIHLAFVGDGPERDALQRLVIALGLGDRVTFTGHLQDVRPAFRDFDLLALTSHTEGFPNVVLESFCMDTPVLATDVGGVAEVVSDGRTGVLIPPHRPDAIAAGLDRLLGAPAWARMLAAEGKRMVFEQFSFQRRVEKEETVYRELAAVRRRTALAAS
jgi:glycosyltransferase involved in cell wall biosynthesis